MPDTSKQEIKLFYCYAREDKLLRDEFEKHLSSLKRYYHLANWHDREILPGEDWEKAIDEQLNRADIIFLLISPDFMASDYCYGKEMQRALERHEAGSCLVVPILLRPTHWIGEPFGKLQLLPTDAKPITRWPDRDEAFHDVVKGVSRAIQALPLHKTKEEWLAEGLAYFKTNQFQEALTAYNKAIKRDSTFALTYQRKGEALFRLNRFPEAMADFERAVSLDRFCLPVYIGKGECLERLNQPRKALITYAQCLAYAEEMSQQQWNAECHNARGDAFYYLKLYAEALEDYEQAIHLDPNYARAYNNKGTILFVFKRYKEEALAANEQAIRLDPNDARAYNNKGYALYALKRYEEALAVWEQTIRLDPNYSKAYHNIGNALNQLKRHQEAEQAYEKARQLGYKG